MRRAFPDAAVARMDTDTMRSRGSHERTLDAFRDRQIDILVGTQMIAKGLDFPNVMLVGVVNADAALHLADFRAAERTCQGRALEYQRDLNKPWMGCLPGPGLFWCYLIYCVLCSEPVKGGVVISLQGAFNALRAI